MATNTTTMYDHITCKCLIRSGSPTIYQLIPKKENIGTLKRMTLGEKNPTKVHKTILLVGETGTGKSTLINALVNYAMGVTWKDNIWFEIVEEEKQSQKCVSQTSDVIMYEIFGFEDKTLPYSLTIIDTPGYGDTRGPEHDDAISTRLTDVFRSQYGVHEINVVGLVLKASENRLSDHLRHVFDSVASLFGKEMENNIVSLITHSDGMTPENVLDALNAANIKCAKDENNQPVHFLFNNLQNKERTKKIRVLKNAYETTMEGMSEFGEFLLKKAPQQLKTTVAVLDERIRLTASIQNLQERVKLIEFQQKEIQQTQEALRKHEQEMKITVEVDEAYKDKETISRGMWLLVFYEGAVSCNVCKENCHYPGCTMAWYPKHCEVMKNGRCTVCTGKCPVSDHVKEKWRYVAKTRKLKKTLQDVKKKFDQSKADCEEKTSLLETVQKKMDELEKDKDQWLEDSFKHVLKLEQIALNVDSLSTHIHLDFLIEKMKENSDRFKEKVQKLEEIKRRVNKGTKAGLGYKLGRLAAAAGRALK
ncbi:uncharacterized protein LOC132992485 [Labrus mixtus]|uniref:uncharacterized protein LOC132992485 n=1 Tax=Labrus mixtus TaxID=508554 RepID=UPI0029BFB964|nr:uncharacterized protein LOC132992485 [Labrus mixtus]XP_060917776.1 uncharacterized protein LOC132992485 [Labrus mixtus]